MRNTQQQGDEVTKLRTQVKRLRRRNQKLRMQKTNGALPPKKTAQSAQDFGDIIGTATEIALMLHKRKA
jgi:hypothetical protein